MLYNRYEGILISIAIFLIAVSLACGEVNHAQAPSPLLPEHYDIHVQVLTEKADLEATTTVTLRNSGSATLNELVLYLHDELQVDSIRIKGADKILDFQQPIIDTQYSITLKQRELKIAHTLPAGATVTLEFAYHGTITGTEVRSKSDGYIKIHPNSIFLRAALYTNWFPVPNPGFESFNNTATFDLVYDLPARFEHKAIAFGTLLSESTEGARYITQWKIDTPITVVFPQLWAYTGWIRRQSGDFVLYHLDNNKSRKAADVYWLVGSELLRYFHRYFGAGLPQPSTFHLAELDIPSGGYTSIGTLGLSRSDFSHILIEDKQYSMLDWLGHELVHEYVMTPVVTDAPGAAVIQDGFCLHFHLPVMEEVLNKLGDDPDVSLFTQDEGRRFRSWDIHRKFWLYERGFKEGKDWQGELPPHKPLADITLAEYSVYKDRWLTADKEQIVLYRLQQLVDEAGGDGTFLKAYGKYLQDHRKKPATLEIFRQYMQRASSIDLQPFFHRWFCTEELLPDQWKNILTGKTRAKSSE